MEISKFDSQKRNPNRVNMYIDGSFFCGVSLDVLAKFNLYVGKTLTDGDLESILKTDIEVQLFNRACSYLARCPRSRKEIERYLYRTILKKKTVWYSDMDTDLRDGIISNVVANLEKYGYIDDESYTEQYISSRLNGKPSGKTVLISELLTKGIPKDIVISKVDELVGDEYSLLKKTYEKKYHGEKISYNDSKKVAFLYRKGFSWDLIEQFINNEFGE